MNNLVGIKPTVGLTSRDLVIPISPRQDTVGPMAKTVTDAAYVLSVIAGQDLKHDNYTSAQPFATPPDYTKALNLSSLHGARIGIPRVGIIPYQHLHGHDSSKKNAETASAAFNATIKLLESAGATVVDNADMTFCGHDLQGYLEKLEDSRNIVLNIDFLESLEKYLSNLIVNPAEIHNLLDLIAFTKSEPGEDYPARDIAIWEHAISLNLSASSPEVWQAYQDGVHLASECGIIGAMDTYNLDALIMPSTGASIIPAVLGTPMVTVPMGSLGADADVGSSQRDLVDEGPNIPFGLSFLGRKWSEEKLISYAYAYEQRTHFRRQIKPYLVPKAELGQRGKQGIAFESVQTQELLVEGREW